MPAPPLQWTAGGGTPGHARPAGAEKCFEHRLRSIIASPQRATREAQPMICSETWRYIHRPALHLVLEVSPDAPRAPSTGRRMFGRSGLTLRCATGPEWRCCLSRRCAPPPSPSLRAARARPRLSPPRSAGALARTVCRSCCVCGLISGGHPLQAHPRLPSFAMQANHAR